MCAGYLHAETTFYIINIFSSQISSLNSAGAGPAPLAGAGTYFRYKAALSKDSPKDTFGIRSGVPLISTDDSYRKGAPMKMPTLLATANQKLRAFVRRRSFSERSRWLGIFCCGSAAFFVGES